MFRSPHHSSFT